MDCQSPDWDVPYARCFELEDRQMTEPADPDNDPVTSRRRFLREGGALMGGAVAVGLAGSDPCGI